jgi:Kdo2-lipid IVA lauroyltransferase/acyltransferase
MREQIEYWRVVAVARAFGWMPRGMARRLAGGIAWGGFHAAWTTSPRGRTNLEIALPQLNPKERRSVLRGVYRNLGWQLVEFCRMPRYTATGFEPVSSP